MSTPQLTLAVALHQSGDTIAEDEDEGGGWETEQAADGLDMSLDTSHDASFGSDAEQSPAQAAGHSRKPVQRRQQRRRRQQSATGAGLYSEDATFLAELLADANIAETDLKDIVGDGIAFIHERQSDWQTRVGKEKADRCVVRDSNLGHPLLLPPANWCPMFASRTTQGLVHLRPPGRAVWDWILPRGSSRRHWPAALERQVHSEGRRSPGPAEAEHFSDGWCAPPRPTPPPNESQLRRRQAAPQSGDRARRSQGSVSALT